MGPFWDVGEIKKQSIRLVQRTEIKNEVYELNSYDLPVNKSYWGVQLARIAGSDSTIFW
jgi:hypothetical protein